ncbi:MAG: DUF1883 domain-containing protein [Chloroflexota bacterium]|nr:DUF1883 domain-containing protein [Chloroflexota bacterium]
MATSQATIHDLKHRSRGDIVEVTLRGSGANVRLMNTTNFARYKRGTDFKCGGGLVKKSPVHLAIPSTGHWYVVVDLLGLKGRTTSSVRVLPKPMAPIRQTSSPIPSAPPVQQRAPLSAVAVDRVAAKTYDVFISHASEDKDEVVRLLARALVEEDLEVWYDEFELKIGDSLRQKIDLGLANSRAGIVVLSHAFFRKGWTTYELNGVVTNDVAGKQKLLPIWHGLSHEEVRSYSPSLADKVARSTADFSVEEIAAEIGDLLREQTQ